MRQKTLLKIIGLMRNNLGKGLTILDISKQLKIGYRPAYNHINEMGMGGMLQINKVGSAKQCFLNFSCPQTRHLLEALDMQRKDELCKKHPKLRIIDTLISKLTENFISDIHAVVLFGSYAKGTATKQSDIDLLCIMHSINDKNLRESVERESARYQYSHNIKINPLITDIGEFKEMLKSKELNVGKEVKEYGVSLYGHELFWRIIA